VLQFEKDTAAEAAQVDEGLVQAEVEAAAAQVAVDEAERAAAATEPLTQEEAIVDEAELEGEEQYIPLKIRDCRTEPKKRAAIGSPVHVQIRIEWQQLPLKKDWSWEPLENFCSNNYLDLLANYFDKAKKGRQMAKYLPK
jgi:hypothetical protein